MKKQGNNRKNWVLKHPLITCLIVFLISLISLILALLVMVFVEWHYKCFYNILSGWLRRDVHFDGNEWFSAVSSLLGSFFLSLPGVFCAMYAIYHAQNLHDMDDRYNRPMLDLERAGLFLMKAGDLEMVPKTWSPRRSAASGVKGHDWFMDIEISAYVKNAIAVKKIDIQRVEFSIGQTNFVFKMESTTEQKRKKIIEYKRYPGVGQEKLYLAWNMNYFELSETQKKEAFKTEMGRYISDRISDPPYDYLIMKVFLQLEYEFGNNKAVQNILNVEFDKAEIKRDSQKSLVKENESSNGYFTYETIDRECSG